MPPSRDDLNKKRLKTLLSEHFSFFLLTVAVLTGAIRVHALGFGRPDAAKLAGYKVSKNLTGFMYKAPWNGDDKLVFVTNGFSAEADVSRLGTEAAERLAAGRFVRLTHYYIYEPQEPRNPGVFNYRRYLLSRGVKYRITVYGDGITEENVSVDNFFSGVFRLPGAFLRNGISHFLSQCPGSTASAAMAIMTGETGTLDEDTKTAFRDAGISHLTAVSGMHVAYVLAPVRFLGKNKYTGIKARNLLLLPPLALFVMIADYSCSVVRAGFSAAFGAVASACGRSFSRTDALLLSAALQISVNPYVVFGSGFLLSYASVLSLLYIRPRLTEMFISLRYKEKRNVITAEPVDLRALASGLSVNIGIMPLSACMFGAVVPLSFLTTLLLSPLAAAICVSGYLFCILSMFNGIYVFRPLAFLLKFFLAGTVGIAGTSASLAASLPAPFGRINTGKFSPLVLVPVYAVIILLVLPGNRRRGAAGEENKRFYADLFRESKDSGRRKGIKRFAGKRAAAALIAVILALWAVFAGFRKNTVILEALIIDVGQGSAALVKADGYNILVDTGGGDTDVVSAVEARGVSEIDAVVLSHGHSDHAGGLNAVLSHFAPGTLYLSSDSGGGLLRAEFEALEASWRVTTVESGDRLVLGRVTVEFICAESFFGGRTDADENNASLCLRFSCEYGSIIFTGDLQKEGEAALCAAGAFSRSDVLVVPHHGSASGSGEKMLSIIRPEYAIISVGSRNTYGHPSSDTVARLEDAGAAVFRTDTGGGITVRICRTLFSGKGRISVWQTLKT